jgi:hypothetical protein
MGKRLEVFRAANLTVRSEEIHRGDVEEAENNLMERSGLGELCASVLR